MYKGIIRFIKNGVATFRAASRGQYRADSPEIEQIRREIMQAKTGYSQDRANLRNDRKNVARDIRRAFDKLVSEHG
jgi:hypothetical protein